MMNNKLELNVNECFRLLDESFNRVKYFSCITDNLSATVLPQTWQITNASGFIYDIPEISKNDVGNFVEGYKYFMQRYLVRDCIESFALCLDSLFFIFLLNGKRLHSNQVLYEALSTEEKAALKAFERNGISYKVQELEKKFNLKLPEDHHKGLSSLKDIRHCLSHSNGIVRHIDGKEDKEGSRLFQWSVFSIFAVGIQSGKRFKIELHKAFEEEVNICAKLGNQSKSFKVGEHLSFTSSETYEIALSLHYVALEYLKQVGESSGSSTAQTIDENV